MHKSFVHNDLKIVAITDKQTDLTEGTFEFSIDAFIKLFIVEF